MHRPHVIINCAMSADGKIALPNRNQVRISCDEDIKRMYMLRNQCDAVLVGIGTVLSDDPKLTVKQSYVKNPQQPVRIVLDSNGRTPPDALVLNEAAKTIIITSEANQKKSNKKHIEFIGCPTDTQGYLDIHYILHLLYQKGIKTLLVEGGSTVIWNFIKNNVVDEIFVYIGPYIIGGKETPTMADGSGIDNENDLFSLHIEKVQRLNEGILIHYKALVKK